jgi:hypothetical protein
MEPEPILPEPKSDASDLHAEGIDLVGSSVALDNEFSKPEEASEIDSVADVSAEPPIEKDIDAETKPATPTPVQTPISSIPTIPAGIPPQQKATTEQIPAAPVVPRNNLIPDDNKKPLQNDPSIRPLRTFKSDAEEAVKYGNISRVDIAIAAQKKREAQKPIEYQEEKHTSPGLYIALIAIVIIVLSGGWYYWFNSSATPQGKIVAPKVTIIGIVGFAKASIVTLDASSDPVTLIAAKISASTPSLGTVAAIAPISSATATTMVPVSNVLANTHIPNRLLRSLAPEYMIGSYEYDVQSPFIILKNTFFQNAYAGMLEWENTLGADLVPLINISDNTVSAADASRGTFSDGVISNVNVRVLKDAAGKVILAYAFADKDTVVITTNQTALKYLLNQILEVRTIQ